MRRTVLVTGGAKRLGAAIARSCAAAGHGVVIHYNRSRDDAATLAAEIGAVGAVDGDLAITDAITDLWARACAVAGGPVEALVNSASLFEFDRPEQVDVALAARLQAVNCTAPVLLAGCLAGTGDRGRGGQPAGSEAGQSEPGLLLLHLVQGRAGARHHPDGAGVRAGRQGQRGGARADAGERRPVGGGVRRGGTAQPAATPVGAAAVADAVAYLLGAESVTGQTLYVDCGQRFCRRDGDVMFEGRGEADA